ncbi:hypothetical protein EV359DRAFT_51748, partial [Lentinula novae-zelandiae]
MHDYLQGSATNIDIYAIQEPYIDSKGRTRALPHLRVIYPTGHTEYFGNANRPKSRSIIMISTHIPTDNWTQIDIDSPDITAIQITTGIGIIRIFNIY